MALNYQNIYGNSKIVIYHQSLNGSIVTKELSKTQLNFCKLCLFEKLSLTKTLNDPNLLE